MDCIKNEDPRKPGVNEKRLNETHYESFVRQAVKDLMAGSTVFAYDIGQVEAIQKELPGQVSVKQEGPWYYRLRRKAVPWSR